MEKRLTEAQFRSAITALGDSVGAQTIEIAHGVLVEGQRQSDFADRLSLTKGAISQAVSRIWQAHCQMVPQGFERVTAILPEYQAHQVKKWAQDAERRLNTRTPNTPTEGGKKA